jgi:hypothetical protein
MGEPQIRTRRQVKVNHKEVVLCYSNNEIIPVFVDLNRKTNRALQTIFTDSPQIKTRRRVKGNRVDQWAHSLHKRIRISAIFINRPILKNFPSTRF